MSSLDGKVLIGQDRFCVTVPGHREVGGTLDGTGEDDSTADACLQVLGRQRDPQRLWRWKEDEAEKSDRNIMLFEMSIIAAHSHFIEGTVLGVCAGLPLTVHWCYLHY